MPNIAQFALQVGVIALVAVLVLDEYEIIELRVPPAQLLSFIRNVDNQTAVVAGDVVCDGDTDVDRPRLGADGLYPQEALLRRIAAEQKYYGTWRQVRDVTYTRPQLSDLPGDHTPSIVGCVPDSELFSTFTRLNATIFTSPGDCIDACVNSTFRYAVLDRDGCLCQSRLPATVTYLPPMKSQVESLTALRAASVEALCDAPARASVFGTGLHKMLVGLDGLHLGPPALLDLQFAHRPTYRTYLQCGTQNVSSWQHRDMNVLIPVRGRERNLRTTILYLLDSVKQVSSTFRVRIVVIELGNPCRFKQLTADLDVDWYCVPFQTYRLHGTFGVFSRAFGFNFGFTVSYPAVWTLYHDADMPVEKDFFSKIVNSYLSNVNMTALQTYAHKHVEYLRLRKSERIRALALGNKTLLNLVDIAGGYKRNSRGIMYGGSTLIRRDVFLSIGGFYAEVFWGWAGEDRNFWQRLSKATVITLGDDPPLLGAHLHHGGSEVDEYPKGEPDMVAYDEYGKFCGSLSRTPVPAKARAKMRRLKQQLLSPTLRKLNMSA